MHAQASIQQQWIKVVIFSKYDSCIEINLLLWKFLNVLFSFVSDDGVKILRGVSGNPVAKGCKQLKSFYARFTEITESGIRLAIQFLEKLKRVDSKHLSNANFQLQSNRVLPPTTRWNRVCLRLMEVFHFNFLLNLKNTWGRQLYETRVVQIIGIWLMMLHWILGFN